METQNRLRRKDVKKEPPLRILSLDGGGVRGYSMLIIIETLMHQIYVETHKEAPQEGDLPKPADHFDLIVGSGTGGLIAIMLGRLRLDLETCKQVYIKTAKKVFETDKRIAGIPYTKTLFKASKLVEAIQECVMEYTIKKSEGNDESDSTGINRLISDPFNNSPVSHRYHSRSSSVSSSSSRHSHNPLSPRIVTGAGKRNALLYDRREDRTKTAVTAVYKGTPSNAPPTLLRSYISRKEPSPELKCTIWEAGRATSAMLLAYKEIQVGQSVFLDEGPGSFNPAPTVLEEACVNEWPSREVGVFVSIGTGKRPHGCDHDAQMWYEGFLGDFVEAKRRIIAKIEACETTHKYMIREGLAKYNVNPENYFRFNVEIGVGDYEMNEWNRIAQINTSTRQYLAWSDVQSMTMRASSKLAKINRAKIRYEMQRSCIDLSKPSTRPPILSEAIPEAPPNVVELPAQSLPSSRVRNVRKNGYRNEIPVPLRVPQLQRPDLYRLDSNPPSRRKSDVGSRYNIAKDDFYSSGSDKITTMSDSEVLKPTPLPIYRIYPPAIPPKVFIHEPDAIDKDLPPYPLDDVLPPIINTSTKPDYRVN